MTINREQLVSLLVEKTGMNQLEVESQLDELTSRIMDAANRGKALEIKGFGLFFYDENGELTFRASDQLDSEINLTHAGMEPVELDLPKPGSATSSEVQPGEDDDETETEAIDEDAEANTDAAETDDVFGIGKTLSEQLADEDKTESEPFGKLFQEESTNIDAEPQSEKEIKKAGIATGKKSPKSDTPKKSPPKKQTRDPINTIIVVVLVVVFIFVGYLVFTEFFNPPEQSSETQQQVVEMEDPPAAEQDVTEAGEPETPETVEVPESDNESEPAEHFTDEETETDPYGLYGELSEVEGDLYTIVVHSLRDSGVAERTADELRDEGYRININERVVNQRTVFRVGIGQFATIREAQQEAATLPEPFNNQNFIQRIQ